MKPSTVVEVEIGTYTRFKLPHGLVALQVDVLVLETPPQTLHPDLDTNASNCPSNVLYLFMSVIPFVILVYVVVKSCHELQTFKSAFLFWTGVINFSIFSTFMV